MIDKLLKRLLPVAGCVAVSVLSGCMTPLKTAAEHGDNAGIRRLLDAGAEINETTFFQPLTPLMQAAWAGRDESVKLLLDRGAAIDERTWSPPGWTALMLASSMGHEKCVRLLLEKNADTTVTIWSRSTDAEEIARLNGHPEIAELIAAAARKQPLPQMQEHMVAGLTAPASKNSPPDAGKAACPLHTAAAKGDVAEVRRLLDAGRPVNERGGDPNGPAGIAETALNTAAFNVRPEVVRLLLERGADVHAKGYHGRTALSDVADSNFEKKPEADRVAIARLLLERGAKTKAADTAGCTPLWHAVRNGYPELVKLLLDHKAKPDAADEKGETPLMMILEGPSRWDVAPPLTTCAEIATLLVNAGASVKGRDGRSPLITAVAEGFDTDLIRLLLDKGAKANYQIPIKKERVADWDDDGNEVWYVEKSGGATALMDAVRKPNVATVRLLLERGAKVNVADDLDRTPLHWCAFYCKNPEVLNLLLDQKPDLNPRDEDGKTPLGLAIQFENEPAIRILRAHGARE